MDKIKIINTTFEKSKIRIKENFIWDLKGRLQIHLTQIARERDPYLATEGHFYIRHYIHQHLQKCGTLARSPPRSGVTSD